MKSTKITKNKNRKQKEHRLWLPRRLHPGLDVTPQNFDLVLLIKILPGNKNFIFLDFSFDFRTPLLFNIVGFYLKWKLSKSIIGLVCSLYETILYQWI